MDIDLEFAVLQFSQHTLAPIFLSNRASLMSFTLKRFKINFKTFLTELHVHVFKYTHDKSIASPGICNSEYFPG